MGQVAALIDRQNPLQAGHLDGSARVEPILSRAAEAAFVRRRHEPVPCYNRHRIIVVENVPKVANLLVALPCGASGSSQGTEQIDLHISQL
jgi:hypothetical protein